jgi:hypothetical protein
MCNGCLFGGGELEVTPHTTLTDYEAALQAIFEDWDGSEVILPPDEPPPPPEPDPESPGTGTPPPPPASQEGGWWSGVLDGLQAGLDVAGFVPGIGIIADVANAGVSAGRGNWVDAGINLVAAIPVLGDAVKGAKIAATAGTAAVAASKLSKVTNAAPISGGNAVIGRMDDLATLRPGEHTLLDRLTPNLGTVKANWARNSSVLREEMRKGLPIRDASAHLPDTHVLPDGRAVRDTFLGMERNLLRNRGWTFDGEFWNPPIQ